MPDNDPVAKTLVEIAKAQYAEVGDGTTTAVLLAREFLKQLKPFVEKGVHPFAIAEYVEEAKDMCLKKIDDLAVHPHRGNEGEWRVLLEKCAATALRFNRSDEQKKSFSKIVVDAVHYMSDSIPLNTGIKKVSGGVLANSNFVRGVAIKNRFSNNQFKIQQAKKDCKIALLRINLKLKVERENCVRVNIEDELN